MLKFETDKEFKNVKITLANGDIKNYTEIEPLKKEIDELKKEIEKLKNPVIEKKVWEYEHIVYRAKKCNTIEEMRELEREIDMPYYSLGMLFFISKKEAHSDNFLER